MYYYITSMQPGTRTTMLKETDRSLLSEGLKSSGGKKIITEIDTPTFRSSIQWYLEQSGSKKWDREGHERVN